MFLVLDDEDKTEYEMLINSHIYDFVNIEVHFS